MWPSLYLVVSLGAKLPVQTLDGMSRCRRRQFQPDFGGAPQAFLS